MFGLKRKTLEIGILIEMKDNNHIKAQGMLKSYVYKGTCIQMVDSKQGYVWLFMTILARNEKQVYHDIEVVKSMGIDIRS